MNAMTQNKLFGLADNRTDVWATPQDFFDKLNAVFNFDLDVCALSENAKCERFFSPEQNGLKQEMTGTVSLTELKRLAESVTTIEKIGGIDEARKFAGSSLYFTSDRTRMHKAIADYEEIGGEHV